MSQSLEEKIVEAVFRQAQEDRVLNRNNQLEVIGKEIAGYERNKGQTKFTAEEFTKLLNLSHELLKLIAEEVRYKPHLGGKITQQIIDRGNDLAHLIAEHGRLL
jgi:hypothetical protein